MSKKYFYLNKHRHSEHDFATLQQKYFPNFATKNRKTNVWASGQSSEAKTSGAAGRRGTCRGGEPFNR